jgi:crossover junction endodeoxyribonuclease RusA
MTHAQTSTRRGLAGPPFNAAGGVGSAMSIDPGKSNGGEIGGAGPVSGGVVDFELPWPPSVNHYWVHTRNGVRLSDEARVYKVDVVSAVRKQHARFRRESGKLKGSLAVRVRLYPPDRRRRDIDNTQKALFDALKDAGVYADDSQIDYFSVERGDVDDSGVGFVDLEISVWGVGGIV